MKKRILVLFLLTLITVQMNSQTLPMTVRELPSVNLKKYVPSGNYSGITHISENTYAVVSDDNSRDGFFKFNIVLDELTGSLLSVENTGYYSSQTSNRDAECITYNNKRKTLYIGGEKNNSIVEYDLTGKATGVRSGNLFPESRNNLGMESLCYDSRHDQLWSITESTLKSDNDGNYSSSTNGVSNMLRLSCFDTNFNKLKEYAYLMDAPENKKKAKLHIMGVSDICILEDGRILVLEREAYIPNLRFGAWSNCKIYIVDPSKSSPLKDSSQLSTSSPFIFKSLLWSCKTHLSFNGLDWANYEGMCLGPKLKDGSQTILLISDSQNRYKGVLQDWLKVLVIK